MHEWSKSRDHHKTMDAKWTRPKPPHTIHTVKNKRCFFSSHMYAERWLTLKRNSIAQFVDCLRSISFVISGPQHTIDTVHISRLCQKTHTHTEIYQSKYRFYGYEEESLRHLAKRNWQARRVIFHSARFTVRSLLVILTTRHQTLNEKTKKKAISINKHNRYSWYI